MKPSLQAGTTLNPQLDGWRRGNDGDRLAGVEEHLGGRSVDLAAVGGSPRQCALANSEK
jgi:hypothetical protein